MTDTIILIFICILLAYSIYRIYLFIISGNYSSEGDNDYSPEPTIEQINNYRAQKQTVKAFNLAKQYISENPKSQKARLIYAQVIVDIGKYYDAIGHLNIILKGNPKNIDALNLLAECYSKTKQPKKSILTYKQIIEADSQNTTALRKLAYEYQHSEEKRTAIALYKKLLNLTESKEEQLEIKLTIINIYLELKDWDNIIKEAATIVDKYPNNKNVLIYLKKAYFVKNDIYNTVESLKKLIDIEPYHVKNYEEIISLLYQLGDLDQTIKYSKEALELKGANKSYILNFLSKTYIKNNMFDEAQALLKKAIKNDYRNIELKKTIADLYCEKNDYESAIDVYEGVIEFVHSSEVPYIRLCLSNVYYKYGIFLYNANNYTEAFAKFNKAIEYDSSNPEFYITLAEINYKIKNYTEAGRNYKLAIALNPKKPSYYLNMANMYYEIGNILEAKKHYMETIQIDPDNVQAHTTLGIIYAKQQTPQNAISEFTKALKLEPQNVDIRYNLALAYEISNNPDMAIAEYKNVLEINPEHAESKNNLELLLNMY